MVSRKGPLNPSDIYWTLRITQARVKKNCVSKAMTQTQVLMKARATALTLPLHKHIIYSFRASYLVLLCLSDFQSGHVSPSKHHFKMYYNHICLQGAKTKAAGLIPSWSRFTWPSDLSLSKLHTFLSLSHSSCFMAAKWGKSMLGTLPLLRKQSWLYKPLSPHLQSLQITNHSQRSKHSSRVTR